LEELNRWLDANTVQHELDGEVLTYALAWDAPVGDRAAFAAQLQRRLSEGGAPFHELEEEQPSLESVYMSAMSEVIPEALTAPPASKNVSGIGAVAMFRSLARQRGLLR